MGRGERSQAHKKSINNGGERLEREEEEEGASSEKLGERGLKKDAPISARWSAARGEEGDR